MQKQIFDVKNYGAVANGVTNVTAAVQAAVDACHAQGGGTVYLRKENTYWRRCF